MNKMILNIISLSMLIGCSTAPKIELNKRYANKLKRMSIYKEYVRDINNVMLYNSQDALTNLLRNYYLIDKYDCASHGYVIVAIVSMKGDLFLSNSLKNLTSRELAHVESCLYIFCEYYVPFYGWKWEGPFKKSFPKSSDILGLQ